MQWVKILMTNYVIFFLDSDLFMNTRLRNWRDKKKSDIYGQCGKHNILWGKRINIKYPKKLSIGEHSLINDGFTVYGNGGVTIGDYVYTSPDVRLITVSHNTENMEETKGSIKIKNLCWIGTGVIILPGVSIGEGCIIGAGSVVTKNIPKYTVAAGNPCRIIKDRKIIFPYRLPGGLLYLDDKQRRITV